MEKSAMINRRVWIRRALLIVTAGSVRNSSGGTATTTFSRASS